MKLKNSIVNYFIRILELVLLLTVILDCNSVFRAVYMGENTAVVYRKIAIVSTYIIMLLWVLLDKKNIFHIKNYKTLLLFNFLFVGIFYGINVVNVEGFDYFPLFFFFLNGLTILFIIYRENNQALRLIYLLENIIIAITILSVILWIGAILFKCLGDDKELIIAWGGKNDYTNYLNFYFRRHLSYDITKNLGIFTEPPMFGIMINTALYTELFLKKRSNIWRVLVLVLGLITCRAVLALMIAVIGFFFKFVEICENKKSGKKIIRFVLIGGIVLLVGLVFYKAQTGLGSLRTHIDDFVASFRCWLDKPIFGNGYDIEAYIVQYMSDWRSDNLGMSNSAGAVLAEGGVFLFCFYLLPFVILGIQYFKGNKKIAYWGIGMFIAFAVTIVHNRLYTFFILAFGYSFIDVSLLKEKPYFTMKLRKITENIEDDFDLKIDNNTNCLKKIVCKITDNKIDCIFPKFNLDVYYFISINLLILSVYSIISKTYINNIGLIANLVTIIIVLFGIVHSSKLLKIHNKNYLDSMFWVTLVGITLMVTFGHMYHILDNLMTSMNLMLEQSQWNMFYFVILMYSIYLLMSNCINLFLKKE